MKRILFTGGGSAGHVVPNVALIERLLGEAEIFYLGTEGIEKKLIAPLKIPFYSYECPKFSRSFTWKNTQIPLKLLRAKKEAKRILTDVQPNVVFSKGGYVSLPVVLAAREMKIPCLTHESDLTPGLTTRLIAKKCKNVLCSFPETADFFANGKYVGSPMREKLFSADEKKAKEKYGFFGEKEVLLVFGGGSGSEKLNAALRENLSLLSKQFQILHLCGKGNVIQNNVAGYVQREYESDMASAYAAADFVLSRSGSNSLFEILALKKRALFVPLSSASRGDQIQNAEYFQKKKLCHVLKESELSSLYSALLSLKNDRELLGNLTFANVFDGTENCVKEIIRALKE